MSDQDDFKLRDRFALAAMQSFLENNKLYYQDVLQEGEVRAQKTEDLCIAAYKIADAMRKARLIVFK